MVVLIFNERFVDDAFRFSSAIQLTGEMNGHCMRINE